MLGKEPDATTISIQYIDPRDSIIGGRSLAEQGKYSFYFDIKITGETNTETEKAEYSRQAFEAFNRLLPDLHEESYIHVEDVRAAAYGYGGQTQEFRFHHPSGDR